MLPIYLFIIDIIHTESSEKSKNYYRMNKSVEKARPKS